MTTSIKTEHNGTTIVYDENRNVWVFSLRGRDRSAESLANAKETIDKPVATKQKPFEKFKAWEVVYSGAPELVEVTGIGEPSRYDRNKLTVWVKGVDGRRRKEDAERRIYAQSEHNDAIANQIIAKRKEAQKLSKECDELRQKLEPLKLEIPE